MSRPRTRLGVSGLCVAVVLCAFVLSTNAVESDGTADEVTTLNVKSKLPFVDRARFLTRGTITYSIPEEREDGLEVWDAREYGDLTAILKLLNDIEAKNQDFRVGKGVKRKKQDRWGPKIEGCIDSLLIAKDGRLVLEQYFADARIDRPHYQMSITKSILAYAIGKAIELGRIKDDGSDLSQRFLVPVLQTNTIWRIRSAGPTAEWIRQISVFFLLRALRVLRGSPPPDHPG